VDCFGGCGKGEPDETRGEGGQQGGQQGGASTDGERPDESGHGRGRIERGGGTGEEGPGEGKLDSTGALCTRFTLALNKGHRPIRTDKNHALALGLGLGGRTLQMARKLLLCFSRKIFLLLSHDCTFMFVSKFSL